MSKLFEVAGGSIPGRRHLGAGRLIAGRNNQDAFGWVPLKEGTAAVICDGCGSAPYSDCGARIGAGMVLTLLKRYVALEQLLEREGKVYQSLEGLLERVRTDVLARLRVLAGQLGDEPEKVLRDSFLFTVLGVLVTAGETAFFSIGDGVFSVDGRIERIGPFAGNAPPYLVHALLPGAGDLPAEYLRFQVHRRLATRDLENLMIGSDGVFDWVGAAGRRIPGREAPLGPLSQFWEQDLYFRNPDALRRRLALANSQGLRRGTGKTARLETGLLPDDTTLVVMRRAPRGGPGE